MVGQLQLGVEPDDRLEGLVVRPHRHRLLGLDLVFGELDVVLLLPGQAQGGGALSLLVLQRYNAHADEVGPVDTLVALGDDGLHPKEEGALGSPIPTGAGAVVFAGEDDELATVVPGKGNKDV